MADDLRPASEVTSNADVDLRLTSSNTDNTTFEQVDPENPDFGGTLLVQHLHPPTPEDEGDDEDPDVHTWEGEGGNPNPQE